MSPTKVAAPINRLVTSSHSRRGHAGTVQTRYDDPSQIRKPLEQGQSHVRLSSTVQSIPAPDAPQHGRQVAYYSQGTTTLLSLFALAQPRCTWS